MGSVPDEEGATLAIALHLPAVNAKGREPRDVEQAHVAPDARRDRRSQILERHVGARDTPRSDDDAKAIARHREERDGAVLPEVRRDARAVGGGRPVDANVGEREGFLVRVPLEGRPDPAAHRAVRAVAADNPARADPLFAAFGVDDGNDALLVLRERAKPFPPLQLAASPLEQRREHGLGLALRNAEDEGKPRLEVVEVDPRDRRAGRPHRHAA